MRSALAFGAVLALVPLAGLRADIAPFRAIGGPIYPASEANIRMEKAVVEIDWGAPCAMTATFTMVNQSDQPKTMEVAFPMPVDPMPIWLGFDVPPPPPKAPTKITLNGREPDRSGPAGPAGVRTRPNGTDLRNWRWYYFRHTFAPGRNQVVVAATLNPSLAGAPYRESLFYCIETGGRWAGTIGEEDVIIRFPGPISSYQVTSAAPSGYTIEGNTVRWKLTDIEPKGDEFDIELTYVHPGAVAAIEKLRETRAKSPSAAASVALARNLLALGNGRSNRGFPPSRLDGDEFRRIRGTIDNAADRSSFERHYSPAPLDGYVELVSEWNDERRAVVRMLADAGYRDSWSREQFIVEGEQILLDLIARGPGNAEAWNVYLANFWRFSFAAVGGLSAGPMSKPQIEAVRRAAKECPDDPTIKLWLDLADGKQTGPAIYSEIESRGFRQTSLPKAE